MKRFPEAKFQWVAKILTKFSGSRFLISNADSMVNYLKKLLESYRACVCKFASI